MEDGALHVVPAGATTQPTDVEVYDFRRSATLSRESARELEVAFDTFSRQWSVRLSAKIRTRATVTVENVAMLSYGEYARSLPLTTALVVCAPPESEERAIVQVPTDAATAWIVQMVGGRATDPVPERPFTPIETALLGSLLEDAQELLSDALDGRLSPDTTITAIQYSSQFAQIAADGEPVVVARLLLRIGGQSTPASIMLPASVIGGATTRIAEEDRASAPERVRRQIESAPVPVVLRLAARRMRPQDVLELAVGDVLALPHSADRPLDLLVGDQRVADAAVGTAGARLACVVTAITPDPVEEHV